MDEIHMGNLWVWYICANKKDKTNESHGRVRWNDGYAPAIQSRPFMGVSWKNKRAKTKTKTENKK